MTGEEWQDVVVATEKRWPNQWTPEQAVAYYDDLHDFDAVDVWAAWHKLNESGIDFAPKGSRLLALTLEERRESARRDMWARPSLTAGEEPVASWKAYATATYGEPISQLEAVRREHRKLPASACAGMRRARPYCDIHGGKR